MIVYHRPLEREGDELESSSKIEEVDKQIEPLMVLLSVRKNSMRPNNSFVLLYCKMVFGVSRKRNCCNCNCSMVYPVSRLIHFYWRFNFQLGNMKDYMNDLNLIIFTSFDWFSHIEFHKFSEVKQILFYMIWRDLGVRVKDSKNMNLQLGFRISV